MSDRYQSTIKASLLCTLLSLSRLSSAQLAMPDFMNQEPTWSPDGQKILFVTRRDGNDEIYVMNKDGSDPVRLTNTPKRESEPSWSPDGKLILFTSERTGVSQVFKMNADGTQQVNLTHTDLPEHQPEWSPTGDQISFTSIRDKNAQVYIMNADGSNTYRLTQTTSNVNSAAWSPDGRYITCLSNDLAVGKMYNITIALVPNVPEIQPREEREFFSRWFPDSKKMVTRQYDPYVRGATSIYVTDLENSTHDRVVKSMNDVVGIEPSPKNDKLLIESEKNLFILTLGPKEKPVRIAKGYHSAEWSPDGTGIVMVSAGVKMNIYTMNPDGTNLVQLTK